MVKLSLPTHFVTKRLSIQKLRYEEAEEIFYSYASKPEATRFMSWATHRSIADTRAFLRYVVDAWRMGMDYSFAIRLKDTHRLIGSFGVINENGRLQFGYILSPTQWGNGYATEVCRNMMEILKEQDGVYRIGTYVDMDHVASINVLKKSGLVEEARLARWMRFPNQNDMPKDCILFTLPITELR